MKRQLLQQPKLLKNRPPLLRRLLKKQKLKPLKLRPKPPRPLKLPPQFLFRHPWCLISHSSKTRCSWTSSNWSTSKWPSTSRCSSSTRPCFNSKWLCNNKWWLNKMLSQELPFLSCSHSHTCQCQVSCPKELCQQETHQHSISSNSHLGSSPWCQLKFIQLTQLVRTRTLDLRTKMKKND